MIETIARLFKKFDYQWKFTDGPRVPTKNDIAKTLDKLKTDLYDEPDEAQWELGHLIVKKRAGHYDVFLRMGEL